MKLRLLFIGVLASGLFWGCEDEKLTRVSCDESVLATIKDLTGLDGCGFVFELNDGSKLEPLRLMFCGTPPIPQEVTEDPLYNFQFVDGKRVRISYEEVPDAASICMVGKIVKITCIEEVSSNE